jgi:hypothetical protein
VQRRSAELSIAGACAVSASSFRNARRFPIGVRNEQVWIVACASAMTISYQLDSIALVAQTVRFQFSRNLR